MAAPVQYVCGPMIEHPLDPDTRRRSKVGRPAIGFRVGKSEQIRMAELSERELLHIISQAADALDHLRRSREAQP